jgi:hypothetical protein
VATRNDELLRYVWLLPCFRSALPPPAPPLHTAALLGALIPSSLGPFMPCTLFFPPTSCARLLGQPSKPISYLIFHRSTSVHGLKMDSISMYDLKIWHDKVHIFSNCNPNLMVMVLNFVSCCRICNVHHIFHLQYFFYELLVGNLSFV